MDNANTSVKRDFFFYPRIYAMIVSQSIKSKMSYRADFLISTFGMLATNLAGFLSFWLIFHTFPSINGWRFTETLFLYSFSLIALSASQIFFDNNWGLRFQLRSGDFVKYCFRPINLFFYFISEEIDLKGIGQLAFGIVLLIYSWNQLAIPVTPGNILMLLVLLFSASLIMIAMMTAAAATGFWIINSGMVMVFLFKFKEYAAYPMTIFNQAFQLVFSILIPIGFMAFYPSLYFLKPESVPPVTYLTPLAAILFFLVAYKFWMRGARQYSGTGS